MRKVMPVAKESWRISRLLYGMAGERPDSFTLYAAPSCAAVVVYLRGDMPRSTTIGSYPACCAAGLFGRVRAPAPATGGCSHAG